jgi:hypothetical protein
LPYILVFVYYIRQRDTFLCLCSHVISSYFSMLVNYYLLAEKELYCYLQI